MPEWKTIDTAPQDGTEILGWRNDAGVMLMRYVCPAQFLEEDAIEEMDDEDAYSEGWFCADFPECERIDESEWPTHWMPIPEGPDLTQNRDVSESHTCPECGNDDRSIEVLERMHRKLCYQDSYGVPGSEFTTCELCGGGGSPNVAFEHKSDCALLEVDQFLYGYGKYDADAEHGI